MNQAIRVPISFILQFNLRIRAVLAVLGGGVSLTRPVSAAPDAMEMHPKISQPNTRGIPRLLPGQKTATVTRKGDLSDPFLTELWLHCWASWNMLCSRQNGVLGMFT